MAKMRTSSFAIIILVVVFGATLVVLYPEWQKLADSTPAPRPGSVSQSAAIQTAARSQTEGHSEPLDEVWSYQTQHKWQYRDPILKKVIEN